MDNMLYTALSGATQALRQQSLVANNIANVDTNGFKKQIALSRAVPVNGPGRPTRVSSVATTPGVDLAPGPVKHTGRSLDVAINGPGWLVVQTADGGQALTRNGSMHRGPNGVLQINGRPVIGQQGQSIVVPSNQSVTIADDGTISIRSMGAEPDALSEIGRLKLVHPDAGDLVRARNGLFRRGDGQSGAPFVADESVTVTSGALESSNVSATEAMVAMIGNARRFQMNMSLISKAESNAREANKLLLVK